MMVGSVVWAQEAFFIHIYLLMLMLGQVCSWVELPVQRRLCPIFVREVGSPDLHECFRGLTGSQRTPGIWGVTRLVQWVEKASLEKIRRLLEVSEQERHCEVLLTLNNLVGVSQSPTPYSVPIISRLLPSEIVSEEHFVTANLLDFLAGHAPSSGDPEVEALSLEQALQASSVH